MPKFPTPIISSVMTGNVALPQSRYFESMRTRCRAKSRCRSTAPFARVYQLTIQSSPEDGSWRAAETTGHKFASPNRKPLPVRAWSNKAVADQWANKLFSDEKFIMRNSDSPCFVTFIVSAFVHHCRRIPSKSSPFPGRFSPFRSLCAIGCPLVLRHHLSQ